MSSPRDRASPAPSPHPDGPTKGGAGAPSRGAVPNPALRLPAAALVALEAVSLLILGGWVIVAGIGGRPNSWVSVGWFAGLALAAGAALLLVARGLATGRSWSRAPAVLTQLLVIVALYEPLQPLPVVRWLVLGLAAVILVLVVAGAVVAPRRDAQ